MKYYKNNELNIDNAKVKRGVIHIDIILFSRFIFVTFVDGFCLSVCPSRLVGDPSTRDYWICRSPGTLTTAGSANDKH